MTAFTSNTLRVVGSRLLIAAVSAAVIGVAAAAHDPMVSPKPSAREFFQTTSIIEAPTTIGSADSDLYNRSQADIDRTLDTLQAMGVQNVRIIIPWAGVQPFNRNSYNWANVDRMVNAAAARNMGVLAVLNSTPVWASDRYLSGHPDPDVFAEFAGLAADRYEGKISAYEVWNEPNGITFWNPVDPVAYTRMLQVSYTAIKAADPSATVIGGVVVSLFSAGQVTMNPQDFIEQMYAAGAKGSFDAISFHPYNFDGKFSEGGTGAPASALAQVEKMRQLMELNGDGDLKIWATEYGIPTAELRPGYVVDEEQQADFIEDFIRAWQDVEGAGPMFIYSTRDTSSGDLDISKNYGFFYSDWTPKLAAKVIADFAGGVLPERPDRPIVDAAVAFVRAIINATERVIRAGAQLFAAAVDVTVRVINGLIDAGVRVVKGLVNATVAVISAVVDAIGNRLGPDAVTAAKAAQRVPAAVARVSAELPADNTALARTSRVATAFGRTDSPVVVALKADTDVDSKSGTTSGSTSAPDAGAVVTESKSTAAEQDNDADADDSKKNIETTGAKDNGDTATSDSADPSTAKTAAPVSRKHDAEQDNPAGVSKPEGDSNDGVSDDQDTGNLTKKN